MTTGVGLSRNADWDNSASGESCCLKGCFGQPFLDFPLFRCEFFRNGTTYFAAQYPRVAFVALLAIVGFLEFLFCHRGWSDDLRIGNGN